MAAHPRSFRSPLPATTHVELIGHRGAKREFPENSLPAFTRALERGADAVELDVHVTADGVAVVHHDAEVRVPVARGSALRRVSEMSWTELSRVELSPEVFVPSLEQVLDAVSTKGTVYVELKGTNAEEPAIAVIQSSRARCAVHSFDHGVIARAARLAPELRRGILFDEYPATVEQAMHAAVALDVWPQWELIDATLVDRVHANGGRVIAWTVNTTASARKLVDLGVDGLCGDDVRLLQL
jgi:glycerophosphoryl diester phosphodiesterase